MPPTKGLDQEKRLKKDFRIMHLGDRPSRAGSLALTEGGIGLLVLAAIMFYAAAKGATPVKSTAIPVAQRIDIPPLA